MTLRPGRGHDLVQSGSGRVAPAGHFSSVSIAAFLLPWRASPGADFAFRAGLAVLADFLARAVFLGGVAVFETEASSGQRRALARQQSEPVAELRSRCARPPPSDPGISSPRLQVV